MLTKWVVMLIKSHGWFPEHSFLAVFDERPSEIALFDLLSKVLDGNNEQLYKIASGEQVVIGELEVSIVLEEVQYVM